MRGIEWGARGALLAIVCCGACKEEPPPPRPPPPPVVEAPVPPGPPVREANRAEVEAMLKELETNVKAGASDPTNPWALAHGLVGFGRELRTTDGRLAIDVIVGDFVRKRIVDGRELYVFPEKTDAGIPVEPHPTLMVKSLLEAGVEKSYRFKLKGSGNVVTMQRLLDDAEWMFGLPTNDAGWRAFAWSHGAFLDGHAPGDSIKTEKGPLSLKEISLRALVRVEDEEAFLVEPMKAGRPDHVQKRKQGIYAHTCGGLHFVQSALHGASGIGDPVMLARAKDLLNVLQFRWDAERRIYRSMMQSHPEHRGVLLVQELKFHGHVLETYGLAHKWGVAQDTATALAARQVAADLVDSLKDLRGAYSGLEDVRKASAQTYYDLIGDGCHAIRGLRLALVAFFPA